MIPDPMTRTSTCVGKAELMLVGKIVGGTVQNGNVGSFTGKPGESFTLFWKARYSALSSRRVPITAFNLERSCPIGGLLSGPVYRV